MGCRPPPDGRAPRSSTWPIPIIPSGSFFGRRRASPVCCEALPEDCLLLLDEAYADFVDRSRTACRRASTAGWSACARFRRRTGWRARESGMRSPARTTSGRSKRFVCTTESTATLRSGRWRRCATTRFGITSSPKRRRRATAYYALARKLGCGYIASHTNFVCLDMETPQRAVRVVDELLATRRLDSQARGAAARPLRSRERRNRADARARSRPRCRRCWRRSTGVRYAIVSDVHGNLESLERALALARSDDATAVPGRHGRLRPQPQRVLATAARSHDPRGARQPRSGRARELRHGIFQRSGARRDCLDAERARR